MTAIHAELTGSNTCLAEGITATGKTPVLSLCRHLLAVGLDPDSALEVYRNGTLALKVRSIGEGATITVEDNRYGQPVFRPYRDKGDGAASPMSQKGNEEPKARSIGTPLSESLPTDYPG